MGDLDIHGQEKPKEEGEKKPAEPATEVQTKRTPAKPPDKVKSGFEFIRGNYDTSVITLLASINANIVNGTDKIVKAIKGETDGGPTKQG